MTEEQLYQRICKGDERALKRLVEQNLDDLWPIARALAKEGGKWSPDDLFQEGALAMVRFAERWKPQPGIPFAAACRQRVRGAMKDFLRRKADTMRGLDGQPLSLDAGAEDDPGSRTLGDQLAEQEAEPEACQCMAHDGLTKPEQEVMEHRLHSTPPLTVAQTARRLKVTEARVRQLQRRAMRKLAAAAA